jgi:hypothetical protein
VVGVYWQGFFLKVFWSCSIAWWCTESISFWSKFFWEGICV